MDFIFLFFRTQSQEQQQFFQKSLMISIQYYFKQQTWRIPQTLLVLATVHFLLCFAQLTEILVNSVAANQQILPFLQHSFAIPKETDKFVSISLSNFACNSI